MQKKSKENETKSRQQPSGEKNMGNRTTNSRSDSMRDEKGSRMPHSMDKNKGGKSSSR